MAIKDILFKPLSSFESEQGYSLGDFIMKLKNIKLGF
jgi:hypothetical protein